MGREKNRVLMDAGRIREGLREIGEKILQRHKSVDGLALIGIRTGGAYLSERLAGILEEISGKKIPSGIIDITLHRDDLGTAAPNPVVKKTVISFDITEKKVILVDDVFYTGRTIRAALDEIMDFGRPSMVEVAVLVDRGSHELPIHADYIAESSEVSRDCIVDVRLREIDGIDEVKILEKPKT